MKRVSILLVLCFTGCERQVTHLRHVGEFDVHALDAYFTRPVEQHTIRFCYAYGYELDEMKKSSKVRIDGGHDIPKGVVIVFNGELADEILSVSSKEDLIDLLRPRTRAKDGKLNVYEINGVPPELPNGHRLDR
jgi:hypothetical protein